MSHCTPRGAAVTAVVLAAALLARPAVSHAYASTAAATLARSLSGALPLAAHWDVSGDTRAASAVTAALQAEASDPEAAEARHKFVAPLTGSVGGSLDDAAWTGVNGWAPRALEDADARLQQAFLAGDAAAAADAMGAVAVACADLADPYLTTAPDPELSGARATFCDLVSQPDLAGFVASDAVEVNDVITVGVALATESAATRGAVEQAFAAGDLAGLAALRQARLGAALALGRAVVASAWARSAAVRLAPPAVGAVAVWPSPARARADVLFTVSRAGAVNVEVFDAGGRRVIARSSWLAAGPHRMTLDGALAGLPAGMYLARVTSAGFAGVARIVHVAP